MEASGGVIRGNVESLMKLIALERLGIELIGEGAASQDGGRGLRPKKGLMALEALLGCSAVLLVLGAAAPALARRPVATALVYGASLGATALALLLAAGALLTRFARRDHDAPGRPALARAHFRLDALSAFFLVVINLGGAAASLFALG